MELVFAPIKVWDLLVLAAVLLIRLDRIGRQIEAVGNTVSEIWDKMNPDEND